MSIILRPASVADIPILSRLNQKLIAAERSRNTMNLAQLAERMKDWLNSNYQAVLVEVDSRLAGYTLWRTEDRQIYIRQLYIEPEFRRKGVAYHVIQTLKEADWNGWDLCLDVLVGNQRAREFWRSVGFTDYCVRMEHNCRLGAQHEGRQ